MANQQVLVPVDIITCMTPIIAEPGDRLMVLNGICLGVDTSRQPKPEPLKLLPPPDRSTEKKSKRKYKRPEIRAQTQNQVDTIIKLLSKHPMKIGEISEATGFSTSKLRNIIEVHLDRENKLVKPHKRGTGHHRLYQLKEQS